MPDVAAPPPKPRIGAKPKISQEIIDMICEKVAACASVRDAALIAGVDESTVHRWQVRGTAQRSGIYREFCKALERAKAQRRTGLKAQIRVHARHSWQAAQALGVITDPEEFVPQVRVHVEAQIDGILDRLQAEFLNEPVIYERCLRAVVGMSDALRPRADSVTDGEVVDAVPALPESVEPEPPPA